VKKAKRNIIIATVLLFVCAAVYLNWAYNNRWGSANDAMVAAEDGMAQDAAESEAAADMTDESGYFAQARLTRQEARDEALSLLKQATAADAASQETIDSAMDAIATMATYSMQETQIENLLIAKNFADCVAYISTDAVTISVPAPVEGLSDADVAKIVDTVTSETGYDATQIKVIEIKAAGPAADTGGGTDTTDTMTAESAETVD
jgi:stage III sporulation protein AH